MSINSLKLGVLPLAMILCVVALAGCSNQEGQLNPNQTPFIQITGGPLNGSTESYTARIFWTGWDEDGIITHFQYALDPPSEFTAEEIANPEAFEDINILVIPGPAEFQDTLRVSKPGDSGRVSFDWVQTTEFSRAFAFQTPNPDSTVEGGRRVPDDRYTGPHVVYVRAQDNNEAYSASEFIGYTAFTYTPSSEIRTPDIAADILNMGTSLTLTWEGLDPDSPEARKDPVGYVYRLLRLDTLDPPLPVSLVKSPQALYDKGDGIWTYQEADTATVTLNLSAGGQYMFGVRAVDVAGAEEPFLNFGRNAFKFQSFASGGKPSLTVCETAVGCYTYRGLAAPEEAEVPSSRRLKFTWTATAQEYGGTIEAYSWGVDIPDLDREGPGSGWSAWSLTQGNVEPLFFDRAGIHVLYVRARDVAGSITLATLVLDIIEFPLDREILWVDDSFDDRYPLDSENDAVWRERIFAYGFTPEQVGEHHSFLDDDRGTLSPKPPKLIDLGRYKVVLWDNRGEGFNGDSGLFQAAAQFPTLSSYMGAGGKLWLTGRMTVAGTTPSGSGQRASLTYPKDIGPELFAYQFLYLRTSRIDNDKGNDTRGKHNLAAAIPFPGREETYPLMEVDPDKLRTGAYEFGVSHCDAVFDPMFVHSDPTFRGTVDSLYVYGSTGNMLLDPVRNSTYHQRLTAIRWHDLDPGRDQGRFQWFGFPMYPFKDDQAQETFNRTMDWFREESVPGNP